ncbi:mechanosensitive ion channel family protein [Actinomadura sp. SCN-SB]|uniref:mechanosensitive ion channel family protein n=1 Tax=Actinomadura sp. SCN-SB TaxID=3373092 RepID=UPI003752640E
MTQVSFWRRAPGNARLGIIEPGHDEEVETAVSAFWEWIVPAVTVAFAVIVVEAGRRLLAGRRLSARWPSAGEAARRCAAPAFAFAIVISAVVALPQDALTGPAHRVVDQLLRIAAIAVTTWLILRISYAITDPALARLMRIEGERNRRARKTRTQLLLLRRIAAAAVVVVAVGAALFTFPAVRTLGAGLLASAGVAGLVIGIAARPTLGNMFAGLQIAFSDAIRLDDVVVVQGQWGRVEELTLSYVVVCLWDDRRLILPVSSFTEQPFENWTRHTSRVIGSVLLHVDWSVPVEELRSELYSMLRDNPLWDRREWILQVTEVLPNGLLQLRATMSAADSASAWDLRCDVREHLVNYIRENHPGALPRFRAELTNGDPAGSGPLDGPGADPSRASSPGLRPA